MMYPCRFYFHPNYIFNNSLRCNQRIDEEETGYLDISVYNNISNSPIIGATVIISSVSYSGQFYEFGEGRILYEYKTDENGSMPITKLPIHNELVRNHNHNFYIISVYADGFYDAHLFHVQIFQDGTTTFKIYLSPTSGSPDDKRRFDFIIQPTTEEIHSR
nr:hypothetical protein [Sedimentibacter sp.]